MIKILFLISLLYPMIFSKFKSLHCHSYDKSVGDFSTCRIKAINRTKNLINIVYDLHQTIDDGSKVQIQFFKRANGWLPFLYNFSIDGCKFLGKRYNLISILIFKYIESFTNLNHPCPYKAGTSLILKNFEIDMDSLLARFPIDNGEYAVNVSFFVNGSVVANVNGSIWHFDYMRQ